MENSTIDEDLSLFGRFVATARPLGLTSAFLTAQREWLLCRHLFLNL